MSDSYSKRLHVVDALRGFAIVSILLLHNIEHFDFYFTPLNQTNWLIMFNNGIWESLFFFFGGKSYAIFALLFGLTYHIQTSNQAIKGKDFRVRFAWRLLLLLGFGILNSCFYQGDILTIYALIGFFLIPVTNWSNKAVLITAIVLMAQPVEWCNFAIGLFHSNIKLGDPISWQYFGKMGEYIPQSSFWNTVYGNLTNGKIGVYLWTWENGRVFQTLSLFMLGMLAGREKLFVLSNLTKRFWRKVLAYAFLAFLPLYIGKTEIMSLISHEPISRPLTTIITSWSNLSFMFIIVASFVLLFQRISFHKFLNVFSPIGKMSLSNYILQSILGTFIYYGFGLGLYQYTGATLSFLIGMALTILQWYFSKWWLSKYKLGPLETLWHKATWMNNK